jgi:integrase/recombinase XerD
LGAFLAEFTRIFGNRKITDIKESELNSFCFKPDRVPPYSPGTRRSRRALASQLYNFAIEKNWAVKNLANGLDTPPVEDKEPEYLKVDEVARLLAAAEEFDLLGYIVLALFLGVRPNEIRQLDWSDVNVADGFVIISTAASKIHERREVPINPTAAAWLACCQRPTGPIVGSAGFEIRFRALRRAAGINDWPKDVMRHSFASYHAASFKKQEETARQMGHIGGLRILRKHYVAYVPEDVANQFWALRPTGIAITTDKKAA